MALNSTYYVKLLGINFSIVSHEMYTIREVTDNIQLEHNVI